jgi:hypothetical protein
MAKGTPPRMPPLDSDQYDDLVRVVATHGWGTAHKLLGVPHYTAYYRWIQLAELGIEPYATWVPRFRADLDAARNGS